MQRILQGVCLDELEGFPHTVCKQKLMAVHHSQNVQSRELFPGAYQLKVYKS